MPLMPCDNCRASTDPAFTLAVHPGDTDDAIVVDFCSIDCLQAWTSGEGQDFGRWRWGTHEKSLEEGSPSPAD